VLVRTLTAIVFISIGFTLSISAIHECARTFRAVSFGFSNFLRFPFISIKTSENSSCTVHGPDAMKDHARKESFSELNAWQRSFVDCTRYVYRFINELMRIALPETSHESHYKCYANHKLGRIFAIYFGIRYENSIERKISKLQMLQRFFRYLSIMKKFDCDDEVCVSVKYILLIIKIKEMAYLLGTKFYFIIFK